MGFILLPILVILLGTGGLIGFFVNKYLPTAHINTMQKKHIFIWFSIFVLLGALSVFMFILFFPSGAYGFHNSGTIALLFFMSPVLLGLSLSLSGFLVMQIYNKLIAESKQRPYEYQELPDNASRLSRLWAAIIDALTITVVILPFAYFFKDGFAHYQMDDEMSILVDLAKGMIGIGLFFLINYKLLKENGQTIGKQLNNIKIVRVDGSKPTMKHLILKRYLPFFGFPIIPIIGGILHIINLWAIFGQESRCIHDYIADTRVVKSTPGT